MWSHTAVRRAENLKYLPEIFRSFKMKFRSHYRSVHPLRYVKGERALVLFYLTFFCWPFSGQWLL